MSRHLPDRPSLEHLRKQARALLRAYRRGEADARTRLATDTALQATTRPRLADAQRVLAREYGFASWSALKAHVDALSLDAPVALRAAVLAGDAAQVARLLEQFPALRAGINEPVPDYGFGSNALFGALQRGDRAVMEILLRAGADIHRRTDWWAGGFGLLDVADPQLVPWLVERGAVIDAHVAARLGMLERLQQRVAEAPAVVHARGGDGQTPLHFAATVEVARFLLEHGADIDALDVDHESTPAQYMLRVTNPHHYARDRQDVARFLVAQGCRTDILMAAALGDVDLVHRHLDRDPLCIRTTVSERWFPKRDPRSGGTIYIWVFGWHKTAHAIARDFGHDDVYRLLMERSPHALQFALACELGEDARSRSLLASQPDLARSMDEADRRHVTDAAQSNNTRAVGLMLDAGWPADARGQHNATPLHWAAWHGNVAMVREILRHDPPLNDTSDDWHIGPLRWALHGSENGWHRETGDYAATVQALLDAGASPPDADTELQASNAAKAVLRRHARTG